MPADEDVVRLKTGEAVFGVVEPGPDPRFLYLRRRRELQQIPLVNVDRVIPRAQA